MEAILMDEGAAELAQREVVAALTDAIEAMNTDVSPQLARAVAATVRFKKEIARDYGLLSEVEVRRALDLNAENELPNLFSVPYRKQKLYPGFQLEPADGTGHQRVRPIIGRIKDLARERSWSDEDVVFSLTSPTTYLGDGRCFAAHLLDGYDTESLFRAFEEKMSVVW